MYYYILKFVSFSFLLYIVSKKIQVGHEKRTGEGGEPARCFPRIRFAPGNNFKTPEIKFLIEGTVFPITISFQIKP